MGSIDGAARNLGRCAVDRQKSTNLWQHISHSSYDRCILTRHHGRTSRPPRTFCLLLRTPPRPPHRDRTANEPSACTCEAFVWACEPFVCTCEAFRWACEPFVCTCEAFRWACEPFVCTCEAFRWACESLRWARNGLRRPHHAQGPRSENSPVPSRTALVSRCAWTIPRHRHRPKVRSRWHGQALIRCR